MKSAHLAYSFPTGKCKMHVHMNQTQLNALRSSTQLATHKLYLCTQSRWWWCCLNILRSFFPLNTRIILAATFPRTLHPKHNRGFWWLWRVWCGRSCFFLHVLVSCVHMSLVVSVRFNYAGFFSFLYCAAFLTFIIHDILLDSGEKISKIGWFFTWSYVGFY